MKKIYGFAALAAVMTLASCSNDEPNKGVDPVEGGAPGYMAVKILSDDMTRADAGIDSEGGSYKAGETYENSVETATFVLFKGNNKVQVINLSPTEWKDGADDVDKTNKEAKVLVINRTQTSDDQAPDIDGMLTILNAPSTLTTSIAGCNTLADIQALLVDYTSQTENLTMSTAAYENDENVKVYKTSVAGKIKTSVNEALDNAVEVNVDRVVAKTAITNNLRTPANNKGASVKFGDETTATAIKIDVKRVALVNTAATAPVVKNLGSYTADWNWNDFNRKRSYWAVTPAEVTHNANLSWNEYAGVSEKEDAKNMIADYPGGYINENTNENKVTSVLVTAQLKDASDAPLDLVILIQGKKYYKSADGIKFLVNTFTSTYCYKEDNTFKSFKDTQFEWENTAGKPGYAHLKYTGGKTLCQIDANGKWQEMTENQITKFNELLASDPYSCLRWNGGACYYYVPIKNASAAAEGIVRNHYYDITLSDIEGLGIPVADLDDWAIDPEDPTPGFDENIYYSLGATINVLKWAKVSQDMHFGGPKDNEGNNKY